MEFLINLLAFLGYTEEIEETTFTWYTIEEKLESDKLINEELQDDLKFLDSLID